METHLYLCRLISVQFQLSRSEDTLSILWTVAIHAMLVMVQHSVFDYVMDEVHGSTHLAEHCVTVLPGRNTFGVSKTDLLRGT